MVSPHLPYEILDIIFEDVKTIALAAESIAIRRAFVNGIRSCLFVSKAFRLWALRLLFQHVHIRSMPLRTFTARILKTLSILRPHPTLDLENPVRFIESITLSFETEFFSERGCIVGSTQPPMLHNLQKRSFLADKSLILLLQRLCQSDCQLKEIEMTLSNPHTSYQLNQITWADINDDFRAAFFDCIHSPHVRYFSVSGILQFPETFFSGLNLVYLHHVYSIPHEFLFFLEPRPASQAPVPTLEAIFRPGPHETSGTNSPFTNLDELESLSTNITQFKKTCLVMEVARHSLTRIWMEHYGEILLPPSITLDQFTMLKSFSYSHRYVPFFSAQNVQQTIAKVLQIIDVRTPVQCLETLELDFYCHTDGEPYSYLETPTRDTWKNIDKILSSSILYPNLKALRISIFVEVIIELLGSFNSKKFVQMYETELRNSFQNLLHSRKTTLTIDIDLSIETII